MTAVDPQACADAYRELRDRVSELVRITDPSALDVIAAPTPSWRARDVLAHMVGVNTDIVEQNVGGVGTDAWTAAQVERRFDTPLEDLLEEWDERAGVVEANVAFLGPRAGQWLLDACTHEHDLRGALGAPGARDSTAVRIGYVWGAERLGEQLDAAHARGLVLDTGGDPRSVGVVEPHDVVQLDRFEAVRAMTGRRSARQMSGYGWAGEPRPEHLVLSIFVPRPDDLVE